MKTYFQFHCLLFSVLLAYLFSSTSLASAEVEVTLENQISNVETVQFWVPYGCEKVPMLYLEEVQDGGELIIIWPEGRVVWREVNPYDQPVAETLQVWEESVIYESEISQQDLNSFRKDWKEKRISQGMSERPRMSSDFTAVRMNVCLEDENLNITSCYDSMRSVPWKKPPIEVPHDPAADYLYHEIKKLRDKSRSEEIHRSLDDIELSALNVRFQDVYKRDERESFSQWERYLLMTRFMDEYELHQNHGREVLKTAYDALVEKHQIKEGTLVSLEDLWTHALQEGQILFTQPERLWGETTAEETSDMIGQTTVGPWQLTVWNIRDIYGPRYGVDPDWNNSEVQEFCKSHPDIQAKMIIDYIQLSYEDYGVRSPYAIQRYFWLEPFVKGKIGQGVWDNSVVAKAPDGDWSKLTDEMKRDTGFYAKQIVCGIHYNNLGLLAWLSITGDKEGVAHLIEIWDQCPEYRWEDDKAVPTDEPGNFSLSWGDFEYLSSYPEVRELIFETLLSESK